MHSLRSCLSRLISFFRGLMWMSQVSSRRFMFIYPVDRSRATDQSVSTPDRSGITYSHSYVQEWTDGPTLYRVQSDTVHFTPLKSRPTMIARWFTPFRLAVRTRFPTMADQHSLYGKIGRRYAAVQYLYPGTEDFSLLSACRPCLGRARGHAEDDL